MTFEKTKPLLKVQNQRAGHFQEWKILDFADDRKTTGSQLQINVFPGSFVILVARTGCFTAKANSILEKMLHHK